MALLGERSADPPRCSQCPGPATRTFGTDLYCEGCLQELLGPIREKVNARDAFTGHGRIVAPRPDWGPGWYDLRCTSCESRWVGRQGEPCVGCAAVLAALLDDQRKMLLHPELPDVDNPRRGEAMVAWAERLGRAVVAGLLEEKIARRAIEREVARSRR